jgi:hypothetical protein
MKNSIRAMALLTALTAAAVSGISAQSSGNQFNGLWTGTITIDGSNGGSMNVRIEIQDTWVSQYFGDSSGNWEPVNPDDDYSLCDENNLVYGWVNSVERSSETQIYSLSFINERTLHVVWLRHVNNYRDEADNEDWNLTGKGQLTKAGADPTPDRYENDDTPPRAKEIIVGSPQERTFTMSNDVDWVKFTVRQGGNYVIRAVGADPSLDTILELYSNEQDLIEVDDDGGDRLDACISRRLETGIYLLRVRCYDEYTNDNHYTLIVIRE